MKVMEVGRIWMPYLNYERNFYVYEWYVGVGSVSLPVYSTSLAIL